MTTFKVVSVHIFTDCLPCFSDIVILGQICFLIFETPEPSFNHDIVSPAAFTIHALTDLVLFEKIELKKDCYFAGFQEGKILCRSLEYARYFFNIHSAEQFVKEYRGYAGLRCNLCKVAWGLAVPGMEPGQREELKPYEKNGQVMNFPSYHDGVKYQKTHHLEKSTYVLPLASREKELYIAA